MRPRITFTSLLISLVMIGSWPASGISSLASLPTLERIEKKPSLSLHPKVDPKGFLLEYHRTKNHLIAGNLPAFEDGLVKLGSGLDRPQMMVELYSLAVEADFSSNIDPLHFQQGLDRVKNVTIPMQVVVSRGLTPPDFNDDNWRWARANYHYSTRNSSALKELLGLRVKTDAAQDEDHLRGTLVDGYIESLLARLDNSLEYAKNAVTHLEMVAAPLVKNHTAGVRLGRISLHLGRVLLVQYSLSGESNRNELLENEVGS